MAKEVQTVFVTGGAGFIGSSLCHYLSDKGFLIICLDNFDEFYSEEIKLSNISLLLNNPHFKLIKGDIRDRILLNEIFIKNKIDIVVHLAARAGVRNSLNNPESYFDVNVTGTIRLLEAMKNHKVKNIVFSSSSSVYGNRIGVLSEDDKSDTQISPYAISKKTGEMLTYNYHINYEFNVINLRLFSIYGKRQRPDLVIHKFFKLITQNQAIQIYGDGNDVRDYTYIDDAIQALYNSIIYCLKSKQNIYEIINIGNNEPISIKHLIFLIKNILLKDEVEVIEMPQVDGDVCSTHANIEKAEKILNYKTKTNIKEGLEKFYNWFKLNNNNSKPNLLNKKNNK